MIISVGGSVLAASKSCSVDVEADTIKVSDPTDGQWEHSIAGRKSWKVTSNHLVPNIQQGYFSKVEAVGGEWFKTAAYSKVGGLVTQAARQYGVTFQVFRYSNGAWQLLKNQNYDTVNDNAAAAAFAYDVADYGLPTDLRIVLTYDTTIITSAMRDAIHTALNIPVADIPLAETASQLSMAAIGSMSTGSQGICLSTLDVGGKAHVSAYFDGSAGKVVSLRSAFKDMVSKVGNTYSLRMQVDGYGSDCLTGNAICKQLKVTASVGNLLQGSFQFEGNGPLQ